MCETVHIGGTKYLGLTSFWVARRTEYQVGENFSPEGFDPHNNTFGDVIERFQKAPNYQACLLLPSSSQLETY
jgi:hypothetical protein